MKKKTILLSATVCVFLNYYIFGLKSLFPFSPYSPINRFLINPYNIVFRLVLFKTIVLYKNRKNKNFFI